MTFNPKSSVSNSDGGCGYNSSGVLQLYDSQGATNSIGRWQITGSPFAGAFDLQNGAGDTMTIFNAGSGNDLLLGSTSTQTVLQGYAYVPQTGKLYNYDSGAYIDLGAGYLPTTINSEPVTGFCVFEFNNEDLCILINDNGEFEIFSLSDGSKYFAVTLKLNDVTEIIDLDAFETGEGEFELAVIALDDDSVQVLAKYDIKSTITTLTPINIMPNSVTLRGEVINLE